MKLAICFNGLPRLINKCHQDIFNYFIKDNNIDIYAHFWWSEEYKFKTNRLHVNEKFEEKPVEDFINLYKPKKIVYEECPDREVDLTSINGWNKEKCEDEQEMNFRIFGYFTEYTFYTRHLSMKKSLDLIENLDSYDIIIVCRPDLLKFKKGNFVKEIKKLDCTKKIYFPSTLEGGVKFAGEFSNRLGDWFFFSSPDNIKKFVNESYNIIKNRIRVPVHNQERYNFLIKKSHLEWSIFKSSISIRRFLVEEWEDSNYRKNNFIPPSYYIDLFDKKRKKFKEEDKIPCYTKNIIIK